MVALIRGQYCGYNEILLPDYFNQSAEVSFVNFILTQTILAETYVSQCYGSNSAPACNIYPSQSISFEASDAECPFESPGICIAENSTPYRMDSGPLNSHIDLGINAPTENRVTYQKVTTCSPLSSANFASIVLANETDDAGVWPPDTVLQRFYYGPVGNVSYTFQYSQDAPDYSWAYDIA